MSDHRVHRRGQGPLGSATNHPVPDKGTLATTHHRPPGKHGDEHAAPSAFEIGYKRNKYLAIARSVSYAMQAKSEGEEAASFAEEQLKKIGLRDPHAKPRRVQSTLGGAFLRMYLDHKTDEDIIKQAGTEIGDSPEFNSLRNELNKYLQSAADRSQFKETQPDKILNIADAHLKYIKNHSGIAFRYTLNAVIGGVTGVEVDSVENYDSSTAGDVTTAKFHINIRFSDTYDFENHREGEYDRYRKQLARYLIANEFDKFEEAYSRETMHPFDKAMHKTHLDNAAVFASFMYALEKRGWTPGGLSWSVVVPADVTLVFKHHAHGAPHHGHAGH